MKVVFPSDQLDYGRTLLLVFACICKRIIHFQDIMQYIRCCFQACQLGPIHMMQTQYILRLP